jgi:hypothetical protein
MRRRSVPYRHVMDAEQLGARVRARCSRSVWLLCTAGRAEVPLDVGAARLDRRRLVLLPAAPAPLPRRAPDDAEEVRYLPAAAGGGGADFVLVDDRWAVRLLHDDHGRFTAAVEVPAATVEGYRCRWDLLWARAAPTVTPPPPPVPRGR